MLEYTPIPAEQIRQFDEQGYLVIRNVLDEATIAQLIAASDRLIASDLQTNRQSNPTGH
jgi:ectoine hydroxylase-related dioxygenase (phytanoyl-CoA dioxygenase family)